MTQTHFVGMEPVPPPAEDIAYIKKYLLRLFNYLEGACFCHSFCTSELIANAIAEKGVYCYITDADEFGDTLVVIPNVRFFRITVGEEILATYVGETGEVVYA